MPKIAIVTTLKAPLEDTLMWVNYHLNLGVDRIHMFFDDPADPAIEALTDQARVYRTPCSLAHWRSYGIDRPSNLIDRQKVNLDVAYRMAERTGFDWVIHIDQDELLHPDLSLAEALDGVSEDADAAKFALCEAAPQALEYGRSFTEIRLFRVLSSARKKKIARLIGCRRAFWNGDFLRGHLVSKVATRVSPRVAGVDIHRPVMAPGTKAVVADLDGVRLLHFDCPGFDAWERKWNGRLNQDDPYQAMRRGRARQLRQFAAAKSNAERVTLYRRLNRVPVHERWVLRLLAMLRHVRLDPAMFAAPAVAVQADARRRVS